MSLRSILKGICSKFAEPPSKTVHPAFKYGMLVPILALCAWAIGLHVVYGTASDGRFYFVDVLAIQFLLIHLSVGFNWRCRGVAVALSICSWLWIAFTLFYVLYLSRVLYP